MMGEMYILCRGWNILQANRLNASRGRIVSMVGHRVHGLDILTGPPFVGVLDGYVLVLSAANPLMTPEAARLTADRLNDAAGHLESLQSPVLGRIVPNAANHSWSNSI